MVDVGGCMCLREITVEHIPSSDVGTTQKPAPLMDLNSDEAFVDSSTATRRKREQSIAVALDARTSHM